MADKQQTTNLSAPLGNDAQAETKPKVFDAQGTIGKQFTCKLMTYLYATRANSRKADGALGGTADNVGGPFDKDGTM